MIDFGMGPTSEAIAHFVHGGVTVFFIVWAWLIWPLRKQSNMMYMLFLNMLYFAFCNVKDLIFLVDGYWESLFWSGISVTIDLLYVPIVSNFFIEVVSPGWVTRRRLLVPIAFQAMFIPLFIIFPVEAVYNAALIVAYLGGSIAFILVCVLMIRHRRFIRENYSYTEHIDVTWAINCVLLLFLCMTTYMIVFANETWLSGAVFQLICVGAWLYLYVLSRRHSVVDMPPLSIFAFPWVRHDDNVSPAPEKLSSEASDAIASHLDVCMNERKLYLNPKLTLLDVASEIGTNRTYLSEYLNQVLNTTFYEYINEFRVRTACEILDSMSSDNKRTMQEVAEMSGFNSLSTFNRSFVKVKGVTPSRYASKQGD